jgi:hypothetical protein
LPNKKLGVRERGGGSKKSKAGPNFSLAKIACFFYYLSINPGNFQDEKKTHTKSLRGTNMMYYLNNFYLGVLETSG